jgi:hypothetical protein
LRIGTGSSRARRVASSARISAARNRARTLLQPGGARRRRGSPAAVRRRRRCLHEVVLGAGGSAPLVTALVVAIRRSARGARHAARPRAGAPARRGRWRPAGRGRAGHRSRTLAAQGSSPSVSDCMAQRRQGRLLAQGSRPGKASPWSSSIMSTRTGSPVVRRACAGVGGGTGGTTRLNADPAERQPIRALPRRQVCRTARRRRASRSHSRWP